MTSPANRRSGYQESAINKGTNMKTLSPLDAVTQFVIALDNLWGTDIVA